MRNFARIRSDVKILRSIRTTRLDTRPYIAWVFIAANSVSFLIELWLQIRGHYLSGIVDTLLPTSSWNTTLVGMGAITPTLFVRGEEWRLFTYMFLHIGLVHFLVNMSCLPLLGRDVERMYGHLRFLVIYLVSGLIGGIGGWGFLAVTHLPLIAGASAALYGMTTAYSMIFLWHHRASHASLRKLVVITLLLYVPCLFIGNPLAHTLGACTGIGIALWFIPYLRKEALQSQKECA